MCKRHLKLLLCRSEWLKVVDAWKKVRSGALSEQLKGEVKQHLLSPLIFLKLHVRMNVCLLAGSLSASLPGGIWIIYEMVRENQRCSRRVNTLLHAIAFFDAVAHRVTRWGQMTESSTVLLDGFMDMRWVFFFWSVMTETLDRLKWLIEMRDGAEKVDEVQWPSWYSKSEQCKRSKCP